MHFRNLVPNLVTVGFALGIAAFSSGASGDAFDSPYIILKVERFLAERGFDPGPVDGKVSDETKGAIRFYQSIANLPVSGYIDNSLIDHIDQALGKSARATKVDQGQRTLIRSIQKELSRLGYYGGKIDGLAGPQTDFAIRTYYLDLGIADEPDLTEAMLERLEGETRTSDGAGGDQVGELAESVSVVQRGLGILGFFDGDMTGVYDVQTRQAIVEYRRDRGVIGSTRVSEELVELISSDPELANNDPRNFVSTNKLDLAVKRLPRFDLIAAEVRYGGNFDTRRQTDEVKSSLEAAESDLQVSLNEFENLANAGETVCGFSVERADVLVSEISDYDTLVSTSFREIQAKIQEALDMIRARSEQTENSRVKEILNGQSVELINHSVSISDLRSGAETKTNILKQHAVDIRDIRQVVCQ